MWPFREKNTSVKVGYCKSCGQLKPNGRKERHEAAKHTPYLDQLFAMGEDAEALAFAEKDDIQKWVDDFRNS